MRDKTVGENAEETKGRETLVHNNIVRETLVLRIKLAYRGVHRSFINTVRDHGEHVHSKPSCEIHHRKKLWRCTEDGASDAHAKRAIR